MVEFREFEQEFRKVRSTSLDEVRLFYEKMPFNFYAEANDAIVNIRKNPIRSYPDLEILFRDEQVNHTLEFGCGAGWACNSMALHYGVKVTAVDFTTSAIARATEVTGILGVSDRIDFVHSDLFDFESESRYDLVCSIGVLHHTRNCRDAFFRAAGFVQPGGWLFVGLYHRYGRIPFLEMFDRIRREEGEEAAYEKYRQLNSKDRDSVHLRSWFRDQVLHPRESQHTIAEIMGWLDELGLTFCSTNINQYADPADRSMLIREEKSYERLSRLRNEEQGKYFPGFFTVLAHRDG